MTLTISCSTVVMMRLPPGLPVAIHGSPPVKMNVGVIELRGRLRASMALASLPSKPKAFGTPGLETKSSISLFIRNPAPGIAMPEP